MTPEQMAREFVSKQMAHIDTDTFNRLFNDLTVEGWDEIRADAAALVEVFMTITTLQQEKAARGKEARRIKAEAEVMRLRQSLEEEQGQRSRAINAEAEVLLLREALVAVRENLCRDVPDTYSAPCVEADAARCDAIIDAALASSRQRSGGEA